MNAEVILETNRLYFRQHVPGDKDAYCAMEMDADVRRYVGGYPRTPEAAEQKFLASLKPLENRLSMWVTILKTEEKYIGRCGIYPHYNAVGFPIPGEASLGLYIALDYWGRGFATEAGKAFIDFGFNELQINKIVTIIDIRNDVSVHIIKKLGFQLVETEPWEYRSFYHFEIKNPAS